MTQRMIEITSPVFVPEVQLDGIIDSRQLFGTERPLVLEIGCGIGDFIVQLATSRPEYNYLAIDIYNKGCLKTCRKVEGAELANVRVLRLEARHLLEHYLARESLAAVYINCPDPWPKKRHRRRRLVNADFLRNLLFYLQPDGAFYFSSDVHDYAAEVGQLLTAIPGWQNRLSSPYALELPGYPLSKYMRRFLDQGQAIHFLHHQKRADCRPDAVCTAPIRPGFRGSWSSAANE